MESFDVIVIGLGGMGSSAAYHLASRGLRVLGLERFGPAHSRGSSHGGSRIIRQAYFEDPAYVPLLLRAYELWAELERDAGLYAGSGRELMTLCGGLMIGREDSRTFAGSRRSAEQWGLPHEVLDAREIRRRFPTLTPRSDEVALFEPRAGLVRPEATVAAHIGLARRHGAELHFDEPVLEWRAGEGGGGGEKVLVWTGAGQYVADRLVVCPGAWAPHLLGDLGVPFEVERQVQYWFEPTGGREAFSVDRHPVYVWEDGSGTQVYGFPVHEGDRAHEGEHTGGAKVAFFRRGTVCSADTIDRTVSAAEVQAISDHLVDRIPSLPGRFLRGVACLYTCTPDQNFVIAIHPRHPQVSVACGFSGHGFKFVPVVGEILADLALTGTTAQPIGLFDPERQFGRTSEEVG